MCAAAAGVFGLMSRALDNHLVVVVVFDVEHHSRAWTARANTSLGAYIYTRTHA